MSDGQATLDIRITRALIGALRAHDLSGFELWHWLGPVQGSEGMLEEAGLYPTLYRLEAQGLLAGAWTEEGGTRRVYRITPAGLAEAERHGWGMVAARRSRSFGRSDESDAGEPEWTWRTQQEIEREVLGEDEPEYAAVEAYVAELDAALPLAAFHRHDVDAEIGDHLSATVARHRAEGTEAHKAVELAITGLGPARELAHHIEAAQLTRKRLNSGLRWGSAVGMLTSLYTLAVALCIAYFATPVAAEMLVSLGRSLGVHLYAPGTSEWRTEQVAVCGWIGAFVGARRSAPQFALKSRRSELLHWRTWAVTGAILLAPAILLFPFRLDSFAVLTLLLIPVAWVLGTRHPTSLYGETITTRGIAIALLVAVPALLAPGARVWAYDPAAVPPHGSPYQAGVPVATAWDGRPGELTGRMKISLDAAPGWSEPRLELWPATESGLMVVPVSSASAPAAVFESSAYVDLAVLPHDVPTWWLAVTALGPDGQRHTIESSVHVGRRLNGRTVVLAWLLGRL
jgi:DNA-binding PadR family transcriptional regulator